MKNFFRVIPIKMITIEHNNKEFILSFPFNKVELEWVRELPVRTYNKKTKAWHIPELAVETLEPLYRDHSDKIKWEDKAFKRRFAIKKAILSLVSRKFLDGTEESLDNGTILTNVRPYQSVGSNYLCKAKKAILADDMGLGKSIQAIKAIVDLDTKRNLILCPATLKKNWQNEFQKHFGIEPVIVSGKQSERKKIWQEESHKYVIANYDILAKDWMDMPKEWDSIICDEAVYLKNHSAQRTKLVKKLKSDVRIALSGMPMENHLMEFHSIMQWVRPEIMPTYSRFKNRYVELGWNGNITGYKNLNEVHTLTSPYILRREKKDVLKELPPKIYTDFPLDMNDATQKAYNNICSEFLDWLKQETGRTNWSSSVLEKLIRLRQFVESPASVGFDKLPNVKLQWLDDVYNNVDKIVVFVCFKETVRLLKDHFKTDFVIFGETPTDDRVDIVNTFNLAHSGVLVMTDAGKFGLNITGANYITHFGYHYNPATIRQREDRLHRIGQSGTVNVLNPYITGTVDQGIMKMFLNRETESKHFMDGSENMDIRKFKNIDFAGLVFGK